MQALSVPLCSVTIGPQSWRDGTVLSIRRAERQLRQTRASRLGISSRSRSRSAPAGFKQKFSDCPEETTNDKILEEQEECERSRDSVCKNKVSKPQTGSMLLNGTQVRPLFPSLPNSLREQCATASVKVAFDYIRMVREGEGQLLRQAGRVAQEGIKLERDRVLLEKMLLSLRADLTLNRRSSEGRTRRPAATETGRDGADFLLECERRELAKLKKGMERVLHDTMMQIQALSQSNGRLLRCAGEMARVLDLLPHSSSAGGQDTSDLTLNRADPVTHFTSECKQVLESSSLIVGQSQRLRETIREMLTSSIIRQEDSHISVNDGLVKKIAETVDLQQNLTLTSAATRQAMFCKQREINSIRHSHVRAQGPQCSSDKLAREKLTRPLVRVYQRHPGTCLPEGSAALTRCLKSSEGELERLKHTCTHLLGDLQRKTAAAQVDATIVRMRRRQVNQRAMPPSLQQMAYRSQLPLSCVQ